MRSKFISGLLAVGAIAASLFTVTPASAASGAEDLAEARAASAAYHQLPIAEAAGYGRLIDQAGIACISDPGGRGAMGIHYVNGGLVVDGAIEADQPEALIYEPTNSGQLRLVGVEYVVFQDQWQQAHPGTVPSLFGQDFSLVPAGNRYGLPPFYELHAWIWKDNPSGMFVDWNPQVTC